MINCINLTIAYGDTIAVDQLNMVISEGEKVSVVGASGCGKTSLLHGMAGLLMPRSGQLLIQGQTHSEIRRGTAIILQHEGLFPWKNVYDNVAVAMVGTVDSVSETANENPNEKNDSIEGLLKELGILDLQDKYIHQLSGGQRQRVAIARALVQAPDLLLMDEPTGALDMMAKEKFQDLMLQIYQRHPMTSVTVTHDIEEAVILGQKIVVMAGGRIKGMIEQPLWGTSGIRNEMAFYEKCLEVRQVMTG